GRHRPPFPALCRCDGVTPHPKEQGPLGETPCFTPYSNTPVTALPQVRKLHSCDSVTGVTQPPSRLRRHLPHRLPIPPIPATRRQALAAGRPRRRPTRLSHPASPLLSIPPPQRLSDQLPHRRETPPIPATRRQPLVADRPRRSPTSLSHPAAQLLIIPPRQLPGGHRTRDTVLSPLIHQRDDPLHNVLVLP